MTIQSESFYVEDMRQNSAGKTVRDVARVSKPKKVPVEKALESARKKAEKANRNILKGLEAEVLGEEEESFYIQADEKDVKEMTDLSKSNVLPFSSLICPEPSKKTPVYVRKLRELNPQQKAEKKAKELFRQGGLDDYDDDEVIEQK